MFALWVSLLFFGVGSAQALLVSVEVTWGYPDGISQGDLSTTYNLQVGSIIQIVAYSDAEVMGVPVDPSDPEKNFTPYGNGVYLPNTTPDKHEIVATGSVQLLSGTTNSGIFGMTTWIDLPYAYDRLYVRVFEATAFEQGVSNQSHWGISSVSNISDNGFGVALTWFDDTHADNLDYFELIPEPSTLAFVMSGGCGMGLFAFFRRRRTLRPPEE